MPSRQTLVLVSLLLATPAFAFWLWLVIVPARVALLCPEGCTCDTGGHYVSCYNTSLTDLPSKHFTDVRALEIKYNITLLVKDSFVSLNELEILYIRKCELRTIELGAFNGLIKLRYLIMSSNKIGEILPGTFENMSNLEFLDISYNKIKDLNSAMFSGLGAFNGFTKLTHLLIWGNKITEIRSGTFNNMRCLEYLDLSNNRIEHLDSAVFSGLVNLKYVNLKANKLGYRHPHTFLAILNIIRLCAKKNDIPIIANHRQFINTNDLSQPDRTSCNINSLSVETFANVSALERLDLSYNNLRTVDINLLRALPKLSTLYLKGNPLQCDCQLQEVWRWCEDRNIRTADWIFVPECDTPSEVKGMWWGVLEKIQCLKGNIKYFGDYKNTSYNVTDIGEQEYDYKNENVVEILEHYQVPIYAVAFIFGTTGNVILLIIIICNKDMRTLPHMYILNLAISDIIYVSVIFYESCASRVPSTWFYSNFMCTFRSFWRRMSVGLSVYSVVLYSFQRYRVTARPIQMRFSSQTKWHVVFAEICGVWIVATLFAVPSTLSKYLCGYPNIIVLITYYQHVVIFELLVSCVLPLCVIAFSYIMTARHLVESCRAISEGTQNPQLKMRKNAAKIVVGLTVVFVISYVPYHFFWTYYICSKSDIDSTYATDVLLSLNDEIQYTYLISNYFLTINSCLNPVALFCTSSQFRQHLKRYLTCFCKTSSPANDFELARRNLISNSCVHSLQLRIDYI